MILSCAMHRAVEGADPAGSGPHAQSEDGRGGPALAPAEYATENGHRARERRHWESLGRTIPDLFGAPSTQYYRRCEIALLRRWFGDVRGKRVLKLDLWNEAFNTRILEFLSASGARCYGIDLSHPTAVRAGRNARVERFEAQFAQGDIRELPFPDDCFDLLYTMGTIEHMAEYDVAVQEICRVLRRGGRAIIGVPHKWNIFLRPLLVTVLERLQRYAYAPEKSFSARELSAVVEQSGLEVRRRSGILTIPGVLRLADLYFHTRRIPLTPVTALLLRPFELLECRWEWPGRFGYLMAVEARKPGPPEPHAAL